MDGWDKLTWMICVFSYIMINKLFLTENLSRIILYLEVREPRLFTFLYLFLRVFIVHSPIE